MKQKNTKLEALAIEETLSNMIANCYGQSKLLGYLMDQGYTELSARNLIQKVKADFVVRGKERLQESLESEILRLEQFILQAEEEGDRKGKQEYTKMLHKLKGLDQARIAISGDFTPISIVLHKDEN
jgi:hypothetical protein